MKNILAIVALALGSLGFASGSKAPAWFDRSIAGYVLAYDEQHGQTFVRDPKSGFFILRTIECDGAHVSLLLTRDSKLTSGYQTEYQKKPITPLSTGKGIRIGDSQAAVRKKLGTPTKNLRTGDRKQFVEYRYEWHDVKNGEGHDWANVYTFKQGKLIEIWFQREAFPGEGD